jgi:hypothetical protein
MTLKETNQDTDPGILPQTTALPLQLGWQQQISTLALLLLWLLQDHIESA